MSRSFEFQDHGAVVQGCLDASAPPTPPIGNFRSLARYASYIAVLEFASPMPTPFFNSRQVQDLLSLALPRLRVLRMAVHPTTKDVPFPVTISPDRHPRLSALCLTGLPISMESSFPNSLCELTLSDYPPRAQPLERCRFTALLNSTFASLKILILCRYLGNTTVDMVRLNEDFRRAGPDYLDSYHAIHIHLTHLEFLAIEDSVRNTVQMIEWMDKSLPHNTQITARYEIADLTSRWQSEASEGALFFDALVRRSVDEHPLSAPQLPSILKDVVAAQLSFDGEYITLACTCYSKRQRTEAPLVLRLHIREFNRLDRHSRLRVHAMALKSVRWVICESGKDLRSLEVVGVADDVGVDAWVELLNTLTCIERSALRELTLVQDEDSALGQAREDLLRALRLKRQDPSFDLPEGLQAFHVQGSRRWKIFGP